MPVADRCSCGLKDLLCLGQRERDALAEHIDGINQPFRHQCGQHLLAHQINIGLAAPRVFGRQRVRTKEGGAHRHPAVCAQATRHAQLLALMLQRQAIAGLDLDGTHTLIQQLLQAWQG